MASSPIPKARLRALAKLRKALTPRQRSFCDSWLKNGDGNRSRAARDSGSKCGASSGVRLWKTPGVQQYIRAVQDAGGESLEKAVESLTKTKKEKLKVVAQRVVARKAVVAQKLSLPKVEEREDVLCGEVVSNVVDAAEAEAILATHIRGDMGDFLDIEVQEVVADEKQEDGTIKAVKTMRSYPVFNFQKAKEAKLLGLIKDLKIKAGFTPEGLPWTETTVHLYDVQSALDKYFRVHGMYRDGTTPADLNDSLWRAVLMRMPPELVRRLHLAQMAGKDTIDVPQLVVENNGDKPS